MMADAAREQVQQCEEDERQDRCSPKTSRQAAITAPQWVVKYVK
jgi:hypothetical protein